MQTIRLERAKQIVQAGAAMRALPLLVIACFRAFAALWRSRNKQAIVELALRQQLAVYAHKRRRPPLTPLDRAFWVLLSRLWPRWRDWSASASHGVGGHAATRLVSPGTTYLTIGMSYSRLGPLTEATKNSAG